MGDVILIIVILVIVVGASYIIYREKKKGVKCIGCPYSSDNGNGGCACKR